MGGFHWEKGRESGVLGIDFGDLLSRRTRANVSLPGAAIARPTQPERENKMKTKTAAKYHPQSLPGFRPVETTYAKNGFTYCLGVDPNNSVKVKIVGAEVRTAGNGPGMLEGRRVIAAAYYLTAACVEAGFYAGTSAELGESHDGRHSVTVFAELADGDSEADFVAKFKAAIAKEVRS